MFEEKKKFDRMYHDDVLLMICICVEDKWHLSNGLTYAFTLVADLFSHCDSFLTYLIRWTDSMSRRDRERESSSYA